MTMLVYCSKFMNLFCEFCPMTP